MIPYGLVALVEGSYFLPEILRSPRVAELMALGFLADVAHTVIDSIAQPPSPFSIILEGSAKTFCALFLALAMNAAMRATAVRSAPEGSVAVARTE